MPEPGIKTTHAHTVRLWPHISLTQIEAECKPGKFINSFWSTAFDDGSRKETVDDLTFTVGDRSVTVKASPGVEIQYLSVGFQGASAITDFRVTVPGVESGTWKFTGTPGSITVADVVACGRT
jgi:hypothetical protein